MNKIVGYFPNQPTWQLISPRKYRRIFTHDIAIHYLRHEILESIEREMTFIQGGTAVGFYAGLRFLFPEVSHLAHLYYGYQGKIWENLESRFVSRFMRKFKILYPGCGIYYQAFRHGLMHSHHPKWLSWTKKGWYISNVAKLEDVFGIFIPEFTKQTKTAVTQFIDELEKERNKNKRYRLKKIFETLTDTGKVLQKKDLKGYAKYDYRKAF